MRRTGGARGQGRAHAVALAAEGADIVVADAPEAMTDLTYPLGTEDDLRETAKLVEELGQRCLPIALDVRDSAAVDAAITQTVADMGSLDIVVANAGIVSTGPLDEVSDTIWQQLVDTNLSGAFHTLRAAIPVMRQQQFGRIVVTSSMGGRMGIPNWPPTTPPSGVSSASPSPPPWRSPKTASRSTSSARPRQHRCCSPWRRTFPTIWRRMISQSDTSTMAATRGRQPRRGVSGHRPRSDHRQCPGDRPRRQRACTDGHRADPWSDLDRTTSTSGATACVSAVRC